MLRVDLKGAIIPEAPGTGKAAPPRARIGRPRFRPHRGMPRSDAIFSQLNRAAEPYRDPLAALDWTRLSTEHWWLPPACLSLAGLPEFEALPENLRRRLSHYEFVHFLHIGLWLEGLFMERLAASRRWASLAEHAARLHAIREEAGHSLMFLKLMEVSGVSLPACAFRPPRLADFLGRHAPPDALLFRLAVVVGEEVPDKFNQRIRAGGGIDPVVGRLVTLHRVDEARHIAQARIQVETSLLALGPWRRRVVGQLMRPLIRQFAHTLFFPPAAVYELAGLTDGRRWRRLAAANPARHALVQSCLAPTLAWLRRLGL